NRASEITAKFGAANFTYNPTSKWTLSGFGIVSRTDSDMLEWERNSILNTETQEVVTTQESNNTSVQKSEMTMVKLSSNNKPSEKVTVKYDIYLKKSQQKEDSRTLTTVTPNTGESQFVATDKQHDPAAVKQHISVFY